MVALIDFERLAAQYVAELRAEGISVVVKVKYNSR